MALEYCPEDEEHKQDRAVYFGNRAACHLQLSDVSSYLHCCVGFLCIVSGISISVGCVSRGMHI